MAGATVFSRGLRNDDIQFVCMSDDEGNFAIADAQPGEQPFFVLPPAPRSAWQGNAYVRAVAGGDPVRVVLQRIVEGKTKLVARIIDAVTGQPLDPTSASVFQVGGDRGGGNPEPDLRIGRVTAEKLTM